MATLEEQIAALAATNGSLVSAASALTSEVTGKMAQIDQRVNEAVIAFGTNVVNYMVNPDDGNDNNSGIVSAPLKTLDKALELACAPELEGRQIVINLKPGSTVYISQEHQCYNRHLYIISPDKNTKANVYIDPRVGYGSFNYFGMYGLSVHSGTLQFDDCRVYTPLFNELADHDQALSVDDSGIARSSAGAIKSVVFKRCEVHLGDQYLLLPYCTDTTFLHLLSSSINIRPGRTNTAKPIELLGGACLVVNLSDTTLNDGLLFKEGSLFSGVLFSNGVPVNVLSNVLVQEAV